MHILCTYDHARISMYMCAYTMYWHKANTYIQTYVCIHTGIRTCVYVYLCLCIYNYIYIHSQTHTHTNAYNKKQHTHTYIYIYICIYIYMYMCAHNIKATDDCIQWYDLTLRSNLQVIVYRDTKVQPNAWLVGLKKKTKVPNTTGDDAATYPGPHTLETQHGDMQWSRCTGIITSCHQTSLRNQFFLKVFWASSILKPVSSCILEFLLLF